MPKHVSANNVTSRLYFPEWSELISDSAYLGKLSDEQLVKFANNWLDKALRCEILVGELAKRNLLVDAIGENYSVGLRSKHVLPKLSLDTIREWIDTVIDSSTRVRELVTHEPLRAYFTGEQVTKLANKYPSEILCTKEFLERIDSKTFGTCLDSILAKDDIYGHISVLNNYRVYELMTDEQFITALMLHTDTVVDVCPSRINKSHVDIIMNNSPRSIITDDWIDWLNDDQFNTLWELHEHKMMGCGNAIRRLPNDVLTRKIIDNVPAYPNKAMADALEPEQLMSIAKKHPYLIAGNKFFCEKLNNDQIDKLVVLILYAPKYIEWLVSKSDMMNRSGYFFLRITIKQLLAIVERIDAPPTLMGFGSFTHNNDVLWPRLMMSVMMPNYGFDTRGAKRILESVSKTLDASGDGGDIQRDGDITSILTDS